MAKQCNGTVWNTKPEMLAEMRTLYTINEPNTDDCTKAVPKCRQTMLGEKSQLTEISCCSVLRVWTI